MKPVLYFSRHCKFCRKAIDLIQKNELKENFTYLCIDNATFALPPYIDRVPMIVMNPKQRYFDEQLFAYLQSCIKCTIQDFAASGNFCFLENQQSEEKKEAPNKFMWIDENTPNQPSQLRPSNLQGQRNYNEMRQDGNSKRGAELDMKFNSLMQQRESEVRSVFNLKPSEEELKAMHDKLFVPICEDDYNRY